MRLYEVVKVFDLSEAPQDLRESYDLAILRPRAEQEGSTILSLKVGHYDAIADDPVNGRSTREITYAEFQLHRWLLEQGAQEGEDVFLRWQRDQPVRQICRERWQSSVAHTGSVTTLRRNQPSCE